MDEAVEVDGASIVACCEAAEVLEAVEAALDPVAVFVRVADCSVIPGHVTGNTNAPAMAVGLMGAKMILEDRR